MADTKLSALTEATTVSDSDLLYSVVGGNSRKVTKANFLSELNTASSQLSATVNALARAISVQMTAASSGSNGIQVLDNVQADNGTNDHSLFGKFNLADVSPSTAVRIDYKYQDASNYTDFYITTGGNLRYTVVVAGVTIIDVTSTAVIPAAYADTAILAGVVLTRETASAAGSALFYIDSSQLGTSVSIAAAATVDISNTGNLYFMGTNAVRAACTWFESIRYNRALSAAEVLSLAVNGPALADLGASQTEDTSWTWTNFSGTMETLTTSGTDITSAINSSGIGIVVNSASGSANNGSVFEAGKRYEISFDYVRNSGNVEVKIDTDQDLSAGGQVIATLTASGAQRIEFVPNANSGFIGFYNLTNFNFSATNFKVKRIGITAHYNAADAQSNTGQVFDSSGNKNHALMPAAGATVIGAPVSRLRQVRWTNTWNGTQELQYIGGVNQNILPARAYIESIVGVITGATVEDIIIGDGTTSNRYVTITTGLAAGTVTFTLANRTPTNSTALKLTVDPDANATMSIAWTIIYRVLE